MLLVLSWDPSCWRPPGTAPSMLVPRCINLTVTATWFLTTERAWWWGLEKSHLSRTPNGNCDRNSLAPFSVVHFIYYHQFVSSCGTVHTIKYDVHAAYQLDTWDGLSTWIHIWLRHLLPHLRLNYEGNLYQSSRPKMQLQNNSITAARNFYRVQAPIGTTNASRCIHATVCCAQRLVCFYLAFPWRDAEAR